MLHAGGFSCNVDLLEYWNNVCSLILAVFVVFFLPQANAFVALRVLFQKSLANRTVVMKGNRRCAEYCGHQCFGHLFSNIDNPLGGFWKQLARSDGSFHCEHIADLSFLPSSGNFSTNERRWALPSTRSSLQQLSSPSVCANPFQNHRKQSSLHLFHRKGMWNRRYLKVPYQVSISRVKWQRRVD